MAKAHFTPLRRGQNDDRGHRPGLGYVACKHLSLFQKQGGNPGRHHRGMARKKPKASSRKSPSGPVPRRTALKHSSWSYTGENIRNCWRIRRSTNRFAGSSSSVRRSRRVTGNCGSKRSRRSSRKGRISGEFELSGADAEDTAAVFRGCDDPVSQSFRVSRDVRHEGMESRARKVVRGMVAWIQRQVDGRRRGTDVRIAERGFENRSRRGSPKAEREDFDALP